ncbi:MAG: hypothetical protein LC541_18785 [Candidatus Thiodiazotropha sp.]|nr:hypothetical protein [Candidatus Thiodiazotropha sp.]MCM8885315.1 hypothetical protein [Candidatus Thiodiazotropha sp.]MCM8921578.1 hypothetical protein [Candidatus Thiodiazotropha sp.]
MATKIEALKVRKAKIEAELKRLEAKEKGAERKRRNRRLILWGIIIEKKIRSGEWNGEKWAGHCLEVLTSQRDLEVATEGLIPESASNDLTEPAKSSEGQD